MPIPCRSPAMPCINSHTPCRAPALLRECRVFRESPRGSRKHPKCSSNSLTDRTFCSVFLPLFTVVGVNRCEDDWYASDNNLRGTPRGVARRSQTRAGSPQAVYRRPYCAVALRRKAWSEHGMGPAWQV